MTTKNTFTLMVTFADAMELSKLLKDTYGSERYSASREPKDGEELDDWAKGARRKAIARREQLSALHERLFGDPLDDD